jgi:hypothetical protein
MATFHLLQEALCLYEKPALEINQMYDQCTKTTEGVSDVKVFLEVNLQETSLRKCH